jgi:hypothetical protein
MSTVNFRFLDCQQAGSTSASVAGVYAGYLILATGITNTDLHGNSAFVLFS